jgi:hypothetical protein
MNIIRKVELAAQQIASIAEHDDEPMEAVRAALAKVVAMAKAAAASLEAGRYERAQMRKAKAP